jgi:hypothetical protein
MESGNCALCLLDKPLCKSHLIPKDVYKLCNSEDLDPIVFNERVAMPTSRQVQTPLLCFQCEQLLNENGEKWVLPLLCTIDGKFPFYDILTTIPADLDDSDLKVYAGSKNPEIEVKKLMHFAMGIFWKASVHRWRGEGIGTLIELGPYGEVVRTFVRGEGMFPAHMALLVQVIPPSQCLIASMTPYEGDRLGWRAFFFHVPGLHFTLSVGKAVPKEQLYSSISQEGHPIILYNGAADQIRRNMKHIFRKAHHSKGLLAWYEKEKTKRIATISST